MYLVPGLALSDLGLQRVDLVLGLLQLTDTLNSSTLILAQLTLLLVDQPLRTHRRDQVSTGERVRN